MAKLKINPAYAGKVLTKDLGYTVQRIEVDKVKPSQYERIFNMGFKEIFLTDGAEEKETTSNEETTNSGGITQPVERVQSMEKKPRKKRSNSQPKNG
jgi:hypothetical protein